VEWRYKAVGFVSYGGLAAGTRAVTTCLSICTALKMVPVFEAVNIPFVTQSLDEQKRLQPNEILTLAAQSMLDELARWTAALETLRQRP